ncbi:MAG: FAD-dependent oxidoreductase [Actinomycetes bacterium]
MKRVAIVGSGLTGASAARTLVDSGYDVTVIESQATSGGMTQCDRMSGVIYEISGPHIFHTNDVQVWKLVSGLCEWVDYRHRILTAPYSHERELMSWPLQVSELRLLPNWGQIERELANKPSEPRRDSFSQYCVDLVGPTLYDLFIGPYTQKQWGMAPDLIGAEWAPQRIELRTDGNLEAFKDAHQGWPVGGYSNLVEPLLFGSTIQYSESARSTSHDWAQFNAVILTCALDEFMNFSLGHLPWRGTRFEHQLYEGVDGTILNSAAQNYPAADVPFTRRTEPKWYAGENWRAGTVVTTEYPGESDARHYPIYDRAGLNRDLSDNYKSLVESSLHMPVALAGRLATYSYINMDQAIRQGINAAKSIKRALGQVE